MSSQPSLFDARRGREERDDGVMLVEHSNAVFIKMLRSVARQLSEYYGTVDSDDLRNWAFGVGAKPAHPNAWGAIFRGKEWIAVGYKTSTLASNHARTIRVWRLREA